MLTFLLASVGSTLILTRSILFERLRTFAERRWPFGSYLVRCPMCTGFWAGVVWSVLGAWRPAIAWIPLAWFAAGCTSSLASHGTHAVLERLFRESRPFASRILRTPRR